jgi:pimeloyl-ACP methyl ester carboxylesterase
MKKMIIALYGWYLNVLAITFPAKAGRIGFLLFCRPFRQTINEKQNRFFNSSEKFTIEFEDERVQGYRWGMGEKKVLFLHGWQSHTYRWKSYIEALPADEYTVYSLDAPGHGLSSGNFLTVPVYSNLIDQFIREHGPFHAVVGHSLGGFSVLYTLYKFPLLEIDRLILLAPPGEATEFVSVFKNTLGLSNRAVKHVIDHFRHQYAVGPEYFSTKRLAHSLNVKGLIIHDEEDAEAPHEYSIRLNQIWPKSQLISTKGLGHNLRSETIVEHVVNFIAEHREAPVLRD